MGLFGDSVFSRISSRNYAGLEVGNSGCAIGKLEQMVLTPSSACFTIVTAYVTLRKQIGLLACWLIHVLIVCLLAYFYFPLEYEHHVGKGPCLHSSLDPSRLFSPTPCDKYTVRYMVNPQRYWMSDLMDEWMDVFMDANVTGTAIVSKYESSGPRPTWCRPWATPCNKLGGFGQKNTGNIYHQRLLYGPETEVRKCLSLCLAHSRCSIDVTINYALK